MWAHQGTYVVQGNHTTEKGTYVDLVQVAAEPTADGGARAYAFSHSQDLIPGEFAWSDFGQNYKNLALIIQAAGVAEYDETTLFGCPPPPAAAPAPLPSELVGAWRRDFERYGPSESASLRVHYVQGASLFSDVRVPRDRPARLLEATSLDDYDEDDLALLAEAHGFAGGTNYAAFADGEASSQWLGNLTWHHVLTDWADVCVDPSRSWSAWRNGTDVSHDLGAARKPHLKKKVGFMLQGMITIPGHVLMVGGQQNPPSLVSGDIAIENRILNTEQYCKAA
mgnify:CR=1 FL=1